MRITRSTRRGVMIIVNEVTESVITNGGHSGEIAIIRGEGKDRAEWSVHLTPEELAQAMLSLSLINRLGDEDAGTLIKLLDKMRGE